MDLDPTTFAAALLVTAGMGGAVLGLAIVMCSLSVRVTELEDSVDGIYTPAARPSNPAVHVHVVRTEAVSAAAPESPVQDAAGERAERGGVDVTVFTDEELGRGRPSAASTRAPSAFRRVVSDSGILMRDTGVLRKRK